MILNWIQAFYKKAFYKKHVLAEVPDAMAACLDCDAGECSDDKYAACAYRLDRVAALKAAPAHVERNTGNARTD